jgi:hypothetical protein
LLRVISDEGTWKNRDAEKLLREQLNKPNHINRIIDLSAFQHRNSASKEIIDEMCSISILILVKFYVLKKTKNLTIKFEEESNDPDKK